MAVPPTHDGSVGHRSRSSLLTVLTAVSAVLVVVCLVVLGVRWGDTSGSSGERVRQLFGSDAAAGSDAGGAAGADDRRTRELVLSQAQQFVLRLSTYGPSDLDDKNKMPGYVDGVRELITPKFTVEFDKQVTIAEQSVAQTGIARKAEIFAAGLETLDGDNASALVAGALTQSYPDTTPGAAEKARVEDEPRQFRLEVKLVRTGGVWLVDNFEAVTGEQPTAAPTDGAPTATPTDVPTEVPSEVPTDAPTAAAGSNAVTTALAAIVSRREPDVRAAVTTLDTCGFPLRSAPDQAQCTSAPPALGDAARTLAISLQGATNPDARVYAGQAPAEVAALAERTRTAAAAVTDAVAGLTPACVTTDSDPCATTRTAVSTALTALLAALDAWKAYR